MENQTIRIYHVIIRVYFTRGKVKVDIGLAKGKNYLTRHDLAKKDQQKRNDAKL